MNETSPSRIPSKPVPSRWRNPSRWARRVRRGVDWISGFRRIHLFTSPNEASPGSLRGELIRADGLMSREWRSKDAEFPWDETTVLKRIGDGHSFYALIEDGVPKCYGWSSLTTDRYIDELTGICRVETPSVWIWDIITPPRWRGAGHYTMFLRHIRKRIVPLPGVIFCDAKNVPSYRGILHAGFLPWATITRWRFGTRLHYDGKEPTRVVYEKAG